MIKNYWLKLFSRPHTKIESADRTTQHCIHDLGEQGFRGLLKSYAKVLSKKRSELQDVSQTHQ